jgi:hypothetical protein
LEETSDRRILFLDDNFERGSRFLTLHPDAIWVEYADECIELLSQPWDEVWLDHDLNQETFVDSDRKDCGMEVVRYIVENQPEHLRQTRFIIHSHNFDAAPLMVEALLSAGYDCIEQAYGFFGI